MARTVEKVQEMGNFWDLTKSAVEEAKKMVAQEQVRRGERPNVFMSLDERIEYIINKVPEGNPEIIERILLKKQKTKDVLDKIAQIIGKTIVLYKHSENAKNPIILK